MMFDHELELVGSAKTVYIIAFEKHLEEFSGEEKERFRKIFEGGLTAFDRAEGNLKKAKKKAALMELIVSANGVLDHCRDALLEYGANDG